MPLIRPLLGKTPEIHPSGWLAENATLIGDVVIGEQSSVWYNAVLRGDVGSIRIGKRTSIQDLVMVHCTFEYSGTTIGDDVTVGHHACLHGCTIGDRVLVGMGAIVLDKAVVHSDVIIAANAVVLEGMELESGFLYAGTPAKKIKPLSEKQYAGLKRSAELYVQYQDWYRKS